MNYELAKKLKDAGFPLNVKRKLLTQANYLGGYEKVYAPTDGKMLSSEYELIPTLSELIEACGPFFNQLINIGSEFGFHWGATYRSAIREVKSEGSTPEKAVAMLWLELNKK